MLKVIVNLELGSIKMRIFAIILITLYALPSANAQNAPRPNPSKLPVYEYNEGYPIYQDYYHKRRLSIFRDDFNSLKKDIGKIKKKVSNIEKSKTAGNSNNKNENLEIEISSLKKQIDLLTEQNKSMAKMIRILAKKVKINNMTLEGGQSHPIHIHR